jgi:hypothetical protein
MTMNEVARPRHGSKEITELLGYDPELPPELAETLVEFAHGRRHNSLAEQNASTPKELFIITPARRACEVFFPVSGFGASATCIKAMKRSSNIHLLREASDT